MKKLMIGLVGVFICLWGVTSVAGAKVVGEWLMGPGDGNIIYDETGNGNHAELKQGEWISGSGWEYGVDTTKGGVMGVLVGGEDNPLNYGRSKTQELTIEMWIKPKERMYNPDITVADLKHVNLVGGFQLNLVYWRTSGELWGVFKCFKLGRVQVTAYDLDFLPDRWYHLAWVVSAKEGYSKIYVDGELVGALEGLGTNLMFENPDDWMWINFGQNVELSKDIGMFPGIINTVRYHNRALDKDELGYFHDR